MSSNNPLQKYFRQPKVYLSLPSHGVYYKPEFVSTDVTALPVFGMTGMDELLMKTPDALFSGESTVQVIKSCIPAISNPWGLVSLDIDAVLIAIRIATFGSSLAVAQACTSCSAENSYDIDLNRMLARYETLKFDGNLTFGPLRITLRPLTYKELTDYNIGFFRLQKQLFTLETTETLSADEKQKQGEDLLKAFTTAQVELFLRCIDRVTTDEGDVTDSTHIEEWLKNTDLDIYTAIKTKLEENKDVWSVPPLDAKCESCGAENKVQVNLDQSDFFVKK
jgi:hypothetical protein